MRSIFWRPVVLWAVLVTLGLFLGGCSQPNGGDTTPYTPPPTYREMVSLTGGTITGSSAYYYNNSTYPHQQGVFVEGRTVTLSPFRIAKYETTYELWYEVRQWATTGNGYTFANAGREGHDGATGAAPTAAAKTEPVTYINWRDAVIWCNAYSEMSGKEPVYYTDAACTTVLRISTNDIGTNTDADKAVMKLEANGYRLPTEAEWEYAARGGGTPPFASSFANKWAGTNDEGTLGEYAWYNDNSYNMGSGHADYGTHSVGTRTANGAGLKDMSGNVWEWCWDWYDATVSTVPDPTGPTSGFARVERGGSWLQPESYSAVASRGRPEPNSCYRETGFRVVCRD